MPIRARWSSFRFLLAGAAGLTCAAALAIGLTIWWLHSDAINVASKDAANLAVVLAEQTTRSIQSIDLVLSDIQERIEPIGVRAPNDLDGVLRGKDTYEFLIERLSRLPQAEFIRLVDENGRLVNTTHEWPWSAIDVSYTAHFQHFKNNNDKGVYISDSQVDRIKGIQVVFFSKRINGPNDKFLGMVVVGVRVTYFQHIYESIASLPDQLFLLLQRDGTVIARYPDPIVRAGEKLTAGSPWHRLVSQGGGNYRAPDVFDGEARLMAVRPLREYPLVVNVGVTETAALATWRNQAIVLGIGTLLVMFCVAFLLKAQSKHFSRLAISEAKLVERAHELKSANAQLRSAQAQTNATLDNMLQGLVMFDSSDPNSRQ
jgi:hypothetical protein